MKDSNKLYSVLYKDISKDVKEITLTTRKSLFSYLDILWITFLSSIFFIQTLAYGHLLSLFNFVVLILIILKIRGSFSRIKTESILVIRDVGVQIKRIPFHGKERNCFVNKSQISDVLINEAFHHQNILTYLVFIIQDAEKTILPFEHIFPCLKDLVLFHQEIRTTLFGADAEERPDMEKRD
eukprot:GCRY01001892.1.p1 GENE.GCRY01001892.1~~GCRY01001892.1.p1  ORF type:complete len:182 (+),score=13.85 GCRY01001892.1:160-705(+)